MGLYLNPGNQSFGNIVRSGDYVDKSGLIKYTNGRIDKPRPLVASSRPRRFGKSLAAQMLAAYYSRGCDSREIFSGLEIGSHPSFEQHLNQYDVISLDIQWMRGVGLNKVDGGKADSVIEYIQSEVIKELRQEYPDYVAEDEVSIAAALAAINDATKRQFVIIIDEWDCFFREDKNDKELQDKYIDLLRGVFKGKLADQFVKLAYITGILPIKKYGTQSALNNFRELTMAEPDEIAEYIGFTEAEVHEICDVHNLSFEKMKKWYDGYCFEDIGHIYCPNSVMEAAAKRKFRNYWSRTETYESLKMYIAMDFDGLKQKVVAMLGGMRCKVDVETFQNDMTSFETADDILTLLIHLGYLAYDSEMAETFIPNEEVRSAFVRAVRMEGWSGGFCRYGVSTQTCIGETGISCGTEVESVGGRRYSAN